MKSVIKILTVAMSVLFLLSCEDSLQDLNSANIVEKIEGVWSVDETSTLFKSAQQGYTATIASDNNDSTLINIYNFYGVSQQGYATAKVNSYSLQLLPNQNLADGYKIVNGSGTINKNLKEITWQYTVDDGSGEMDAVTATYTLLY